MAVNLDNLKAALIAVAPSISDSFDALAYLALIDDWYAARVALSTLQGNTVIGYTLAGRSVTRAEVTSREEMVARLWGQLMAYRHPGASLIDMRLSGGEL